MSEIIDTEEKEKSTVKSIEPYDIRKEELAFNEFLYLIITGEIPQDSRFFSGTMIITSPDQVYEDIPTQLVILPDDRKYRLLDSATNIDFMRQQFEDKRIRISLSGQAKKISFDKDGRIRMDNLQIKLSPDKNGRIAEWRIGEKEDGPIKPTLQLTTDGFAILDWQEFIDTIDGFPINFTVQNVGSYTLREIIESDAFQEYSNKLVDGELPQGTAFSFILAHAQNDEGVTNPMLLARAELPDGTVEDLQEGATTFLNQLAQRGVEIKVSKSAIRIDLMGLKECPECREKFIPKKGDQIYCTTRCKNRYNQRLWRQRQKTASE